MNLKTNIPASFFEEEEKMFKVAPETKKLWAVLLDLLCEFDRVCRENGFKYSIDGGTLLGAIRHGGFIPWDDDVDVIMLRSDYEKLNKIAPEVFMHPYFWQTNETDPGFARGHARLRNSETTAIIKSEMRNGRPLFRYNQGVFIDVFIEDNVPDDMKERRRYMDKLADIRSRMTAIKNARATRVGLRSFFRHLEMWARMADSVNRMFGRDLLAALSRKLMVEARRYENVQTRQISHATFQPYFETKFYFSRDIIEDRVEVPFEMFKFYAPRHYEEYLTTVYGNWRKYVVGASDHGGMFIDVDRPYTEYLKGK